MNPVDVFDTDKSGNVIALPLVGYSTMPAAGMFVLTRIEYAESEPHLMAVMSGQEKPGALQLAITPDQAREFAARLVFLADHIMQQQTPSAGDKN